MIAVLKAFGGILSGRGVECRSVIWAMSGDSRLVELAPRGYRPTAATGTLRPEPHHSLNPIRSSISVATPEYGISCITDSNVPLDTEFCHFSPGSPSRDDSDLLRNLSVYFGDLHQVY